MSGYTTRVRFSDKYALPQKSSARPYVTSDVKKAEYIYSWRSRVSKSDLNDKQAGTILGVRAPQQKGNLFDIIADRKRFAEDLDAVAAGVNSPTDYEPGNNICTTTDTGHRFISMKWVSLSRALRDQRDGWDADKRLINQDIIHATPGVFIPQTAARPASFATYSLPSGLTHPFFERKSLTSPTKLERQNRLNSALASMHPQRPTALIGETVVDLIRGNLPGLFKSLDRLFLKAGVRSWDEWVRFAGGSYLGSTFAWQPLINDFMSAIKVLMAVDHLVYGSANRRSRTLTWDTQSLTVYDWQDTLASGYGNPSNGAVTSTANNNPEHSFNMSYDIRLSARFGALARPGRGANNFISAAEDKLNELGIWYPALGWDLLPYSWLVDWCTNLGASIWNSQLYSASAGYMPLDYCWATTAMKVLTTMTFQLPTDHTHRTWFDTYGSARTFSVYKEREQATPFGFGLDLSGLNSSQKAILVALGLAKVR